MSIVFKWGLEPRWSAISFMTCQSEAQWVTVKIFEVDGSHTITILPNFFKVFIIKGASQAHAVEDGCFSCKDTFESFGKVINVYMGPWVESQTKTG